MLEGREQREESGLILLQRQQSVRRMLDWGEKARPIQWVTSLS
jgi:hypothetical protein